MTFAQIRRVSTAAIVIGLILAGCTNKQSGTATSEGSGGPTTDLNSSTEIPGFDWSPDRTGGAAPQPCAGTVRCVGADAQYATISEAVKAAKSGDTIQVAAGMYSESVKIEGRQLILLGGFSSDFAIRNPESEVTVIDGGGDGTTVSLTEAGDSTVDGFTVTGGKLKLDEWGTGYGSGIRVFDSGTVTISRNLVEGNDDQADFNSCDCNTFGGGISVQNVTSVTVSDNIVRNNSAHRGAGISVQGLATIERNLVEDNHGRGDHGGGLYLTGDGMILRGNLVRGNTIGDQAGYGWGGGGIFYGDDVAERPAIRVEGNRWVSNRARGKGDGFFLDEGVTGTIVGDLYYANLCQEGASGIYVDGGVEFGSFATISNVTITGGDCGDDIVGSGLFAEGGSSFEVTESIIAGNGGKSDVNQCDFCAEAPDAEPGSISNCIVGAVDGDVKVGEGVEINNAPDFVDPENGNFSVEGTTWGA